MIKRALMAGAFAGLLMLGGAGASSALTLAKPDAPSAGFNLVGHGGHDGHGGHGGHGGFGGFGGFRPHGGLSFYGGQHGHGHGHFRHRGFYPYGFGYFPYYAYYGGYGGYGDCGWLRRRAIETGSPYWWRRYEDCRYDY